MTSSRQFDELGICTTCKVEAVESEIIKCSECNGRFHGPCVDGNQQYAGKTFIASFKKVKVKNFMFCCDICLTKRENNQASSINEKLAELAQQMSTLISSQSEKDLQIISLTQKVDGLVSKVEISEENDKLASLNTTVNTLVEDFKSFQNNKKPEIVNNMNPWSNQIRSSKMKASLCIKNNGAPVNMDSIQKLACENNIQVTKAVQKENGDVIVHLPNMENRCKLTPLLQEQENGNEVVDLKSKLPTISMLDVEHFTNKEEFIEKIKRQNPLIKEKMENGSEFSIVFAKSPKEDSIGGYKNKFYQIVARVSNDIRQIIKMSDHKIYMDLVAHRVVDRFFVKRCNRCHKFGHYQKDCKEEIVCGFCCKNHLSNQCDQVNEGEFDKYKCINCSRENKECNGHSAHWYKCPTFLEMQKKVKKTIPYYEKN